MKIYENIIIGNFIYALGWKIGKEGLLTCSCLNLLQQTPADKTLGDLLIETPGVLRLIEFKNATSNKEKEIIKIEALSNKIAKNQYMRNISKKIHWYIQTQPEDTVCYNRIVPYLNAFDGDVSSEYTLESYISNMVAEIKNPSKEITSKNFQAYLQLLSSLEKSAGAGFAGGGLVVNITEDGIKYIEVTNFTDLNLQRKELLNNLEQKHTSIMIPKIPRNKLTPSSYRSRGR